jgi:hypothetical protein
MNNLTQFSKDEVQAAIQVAWNSLIDFSILTHHQYENNWHHEVTATELEKVERGEIDRLMLFLPPRYGKSQLASINLPAWALGRNPRREIITSSYSADLAQDFGSKTRTLVESEQYRAIFNVQLRQDDRSKAKWLTQEGGAYTSVGIGGAITGRGADLLIIDDPIKNREEAESKTYRDKVWNWYTSTAYTRLEKNGAVILILTRWHVDDIAGRILASEEAYRWNIVNLPAIAEQDEQYRKKGEPLWESKYNLEALESIKRVIGTYDWASLYQQKPILSENQEFNPHFFKARSQEEVDRLNTRNFLTIDTAISQKSYADFTGFCDNAVDGENFWNLKAWRMKLGPKELIDYLFTLYDRRRYEKIGIEKTIYLQVIKPFLDDEMRKRNKFLPIVELQHNQVQKEIRIRSLLPRYEAGSIFHIDGACRDLEEEALMFPQGIHDDVIDATAYQTQIAEAPQGEKIQILATLQERTLVNNVTLDAGI